MKCQYNPGKIAMIYAGQDEIIRLLSLPFGYGTLKQILSRSIVCEITNFRRLPLLMIDLPCYGLENTSKNTDTSKTKLVT